MLQYIREKANSKTSKVFAIILAFTFLFCVGISELIRSLLGKDYVVKIGKVKISPVMFNLEKNKKLNMLRARNQEVNEKAEINNILHQIIWENVINQAATDFGFRVSDNTIKHYIAGMSLFRDDKGRFDPLRLRRFLQLINVSEPMFIELSRKDIKNFLIKAPFNYVSAEKFVDYHIKANAEKRSMWVVEIDPESIELKKKATKAELEEFYEQHQKLFMIDERRDFSILSFNEKDVEKSIKITEAEKREYFATSPECEDHTFEEMEKEIVAEITQNKLAEAVEDKTRAVEDALMAGEDVKSIVEKFRLHVVKIKGANAKNGAKKVQTALKGTTEKCSQDVITVAFSTEDGADSSFTESMNEKNEKFLWVVHVDSIIPEHAAQFERIQDKVTAEWNKQEKRNQAAELSNILAEAVKSGKSLVQVAREHKQKAFATKPFGRDGKLVLKNPAKNKNNNDADKKEYKKTAEDERQEKITGEFADDIFRAEANLAIQKEIDGKFNIAQTKDIIRSYKSEDEEVRTKESANLVQTWADDFYQELVGYLSREKYEIKINHENLNNVTGGMDSPINSLF